MSYSQLGQDVEVLKKYSKGYYIEIGASDGIELSNTYLLEKNGWEGICIEPIPARYEKLVKNRKAICYNKAIYHTSDMEVIFTIANRNDLLSGIKHHITRYRKEVFSNYRDIIVQTKTLNDILDDAKAPKFIEYLSLDTEGTELEILRSVDLNKYSFGVIDVEHNYEEPRRSEIRSYLLAHGYIVDKENHWDDRYVSR
jgi:FkbM family methyltransferase